MTFRHASSGWSTIAAPHVVPALFTRMSIGPRASIAVPTIGPMAAASDMSQAIGRASTPREARCAAALSNSSRLRAVIATRAPISPSASAICRPSPREPPVTSATLPVRSRSLRTVIVPPSRLRW